MKLTFRNIVENELTAFADILAEGAAWLREKGIEMWAQEQVSLDRLLKNYTLEEMFMGFQEGDPAAVMILQEKYSRSVYLHKLCIRRKYAGTGLSHAMIQLAKQEVARRGRSYLRLDCAADRPKLCSFYEAQGFRKVDEGIMYGKFPTAFYEFDASPKF